MGDFMRLTKAADYAVRCILYMSRQPLTTVIPKKEIARTMEIPDPFLGKIAQQLSRAGVLEILQGARGGLRLLKAPESITLLDVIEAVMGEIFLNDCILAPNTCRRNTTCSVHVVWQKARSQLRQTLRETNFSMLSHSGDSTGRVPV